MGWSAARKLRKVVDNLSRILAIELVTAARAIEMRTELAPAPATASVIEALRATVPGPGPDRFLSPELEAADRFVKSGAATVAARKVVSELA